MKITVFGVEVEVVYFFAKIWAAEPIVVMLTKKACTLQRSHSIYKNEVANKLLLIVGFALALS